MTNFSTPADSGVNAGSTRGAQYHFPGHAMQSEIEPESLSDDFIDALVPRIGRIQASGGSYIVNSRFAAHDRAIESSFSERRRRGSGQTGKTPRIRWKQAGFFDLGLSLLILALSGGAIYAIEKNHTDPVAPAAESAEISPDRHQQHPADKVAIADADISDPSRQ